MRKQTPSTFVINVDDNFYVFVEGKNHALYGPMYDVYYSANEKPTKYTAQNFVEVHGMHDKVSVADFLNDAKVNLTTIGIGRKDIEETFDIFNDSLKQIKKDDEKHPNLNKMKNYFIKGLDNYNALVDLLPRTPEISYIEEYNSLNERKSITNNITPEIAKEERLSFESITNKHETTNVRQRVKKYE